MLGWNFRINVQQEAGFINGGEKLKPYQSDTLFWPEGVFIINSLCGHGVPPDSPLSPTRLSFGGKSTFPLNKGLGGPREDGAQQAACEALSHNIFPDFSNKKGTLSNLKMHLLWRLAISILPLPSFIITLFFLLFKLLLFQLKRSMYFYFLTFAHAVPSLDPNVPLILLSTPALSAHLF